MNYIGLIISGMSLIVSAIAVWMTWSAERMTAGLKEERKRVE